MGLLYRESKYRITTGECDFKDYIRPATIFDYFQNLARLGAADAKVGLEDMLKKGYLWVVLYQEIEVVKRIPKYDEEVIIKSWPKPKRRIEYNREFELCDLDNNLLIKGISNWVVIDTTHRMISKAEDVIFDGEFYTRTNYNEPAKRKLGLVLDNPIKEYKYQVKLSDIDVNGHMNNNKYLDIIFNMNDFNDYKCFKKVEIAYLHEARINDEIIVKEFIKDNYKCFISYVNDNICFEARVLEEE